MEAKSPQEVTSNLCEIYCMLGIDVDVKKVRERGKDRQTTEHDQAS